MDPIRALDLLQECTGDDIWSVTLCLQRGIPQSWIDELADAFESDFSRDHDTIYVDGQPTNQFHGIHDVELACRLASAAGIDVASIRTGQVSNRGLVRALQEAAEE